MSVTSTSPIVGIFRDGSMAEQAVEALYNAGFEREQIRYSTPGNSGSFFEDLKSLFTGTGTNGGNLANDLTTMGLSDEEARYYSNEYSNGNTILAVQARGREQEALSILQQYGAYNSQNMFNQATNSAPQPSGSTQWDNYGNGQPQSQFTETTQQDSYDAGQPQPQFGTSAEQPFQDSGQAAITPNYDVEDETTQPMPSGYRSEAYNTQASQAVSDVETQPSQSEIDVSDDNAESTPAHLNTVAPEYETDYQAPQTNVADPEQEADAQNVSPGVTENNASDWTAQSEVVAPEADLASQAPQASVTAAEYDAEDRSAQSNISAPDQATEAQSLQAGAVTAEHTDEFQQLQEQLRAAQQQLEEVKAQLQAAKELESQLRTAREREQQLQTTRQQLQEVQSELAAALAELRETQARLAQYE